MAGAAARRTLDPGIVHATAVAFAQHAVLILGPSGAGKSSLALQLIGQGAALIADDRVELAPDAQGGCIARAPKGLPPLIEARGIGLLAAPIVTSARVALVVDLGAETAQRLPEHDKMLLAGAAIAVISGPISAHHAVAIRLHCLHGRKD
jgi:HPr kinase/phosphorylase